MTKEEMQAVYDRKRDFLKLLEHTLKADSRYTGVESLEYIEDPEGVFREVILIKYQNEHQIAICATGNSNGANAKEVIHAVYGGGHVTGRIPHYMQTKSTAEAVRKNNHLQNSMAQAEGQGRSES